ncbi:MAG TPA: ATP-binding protein [Ignavibacteriaceae bacterium]
MFAKIIKYFKTTRFKTTLWYSIVFLLLEVVIGLVIYGFLKHNLYKELDLSLTKQADMIYHFVEESHVNLMDFQADSVYNSPNDLIYDLIFEVFAFNTNNTFVQVSYKDQTVFSTVNLKNITIKNPDSLEVKSGIYSFSDSLLSENTIRAAYLNKDDYKIIVAFPTYVINQTLKNLTDIYIIIAPVFFLLSLIGGAVISFRALSRIDKIIAETNAITAQNLNKIIEGSEYDDEYGRLVTTMNNMINRIKTSIEYMNHFSISASHELKTPLTILRGEIELALKSPKTPEQYRETLQSNYEETIRLINIVEHLFYLSKIDNAIVRLNKQTIELESFIKSVADNFLNLAKEKNIKINLDFAGGKKIKVEADPELFKQVVINLVENAIKYGNESSDFDIICKSTNDGSVSLSFLNYAEAIPKETLSRLFERFYRVESSRNRGLGGVGIGLAIVKSIVDLHNWKINVKTENNVKIIFTIII